MRYQTRSIKGRDQEVNHDYAVAVSDGTHGLFLVIDGTTKPGSGELVQGLAQGVVSAYETYISQKTEDTRHDQVEPLLRSILTDLHRQLFVNLTGTASYLVAVAFQNKLTIAYEGDCSCGIAGDDEKIEWLTSPHSKANWKQDRSHRELALDPARHFVTRSFRANRTPDPAFVHLALPVGTRFICATDGFWAELTEEQQAAALDSDVADVGDDVTWIDVKL